MGRLNTALVEAARPDNESLDELRWLLERHVELTGSARGAEALASWTVAAELFWHVRPIERVRRIEATSAGRVSGPG
jgi:glutamate synthase (NADPH/NADH) large chain